MSDQPRDQYVTILIVFTFALMVACLIIQVFFVMPTIDAMDVEVKAFSEQLKTHLECEKVARENGRFVWDALSDDIVCAFRPRLPGEGVLTDMGIEEAMGKEPE